MNLSELINLPSAAEVFGAIAKAGGEARFVGGCVRNALLGMSVKDIDIATTLLPDQVESVFKNYPGAQAIDIGKEFGTLLVVLNGHSFEITTLRRDISSTNGRHPIVEYTTDWREDAERRDFTINAMSYSPDTGELHDYFGGQDDLSAGLIKFVGEPEARVQEDYLRILRLFRFYAYYGSNIDPASLAACKKFAPELACISAERKVSELVRIVDHRHYLFTLELMQAHEILSHLPPAGLDWPTAIKLSLKMAGFAWILEYRGHDPLKFLALFGYGGITNLKQCLEAMPMMPLDIKQYLEQVFKLATSISLPDLVTHSYRYNYQIGPKILGVFLYLATIQWPTAAHMSIFSEFRQLVELADKPAPQFPVTGEDIMAYCQISEGKVVGELLDAAKEFWFESKYQATREELLKHAEFKKSNC